MDKGREASPLKGQLWMALLALVPLGIREKINDDGDSARLKARQECRAMILNHSSC